MKSWKDNLTKNNKLFEASAAELYYKQIALVEILKWTMAQLSDEAPHEDIKHGIEARLAAGTSAIEAEHKASQELRAAEVPEDQETSRLTEDDEVELSEADMAANNADRLLDMERGK